MAEWEWPDVLFRFLLACVERFLEETMSIEINWQCVHEKLLVGTQHYPQEVVSLLPTLIVSFAGFFLRCDVGT
jgi:hypothetical protein